MRTYTHGVIGYLLYAKRSRQEQRLAIMGGILPDVFLALGFVPHYVEHVTPSPLVADIHNLLHHSTLHLLTVSMHSLSVPCLCHSRLSQARSAASQHKSMRSAAQAKRCRQRRDTVMFHSRLFRTSGTICPGRWTEYACILQELETCEAFRQRVRCDRRRPAVSPGVEGASDATDR